MIYDIHAENEKAFIEKDEKILFKEVILQSAGKEAGMAVTFRYKL